MTETFTLRLRTTMLAATAALALAVAPGMTPAAAQEMDHSQMDHSQMDHATMDHSTMDHSSHQMTDEEYRILREKILSYQTMTDEEIMENMMGMPPTYERYISDKSMNGDLGVIVLAHGAGEPGDTFFANSLSDLAAEYPTTIGFGMAMMNGNHLQAAVDNLADAGAKRIVVVPAALSASGSVYHQWAYYFGEEEEAAYLPAPRVNQTVPVMLGEPATRHELITKMLIDHAKEVSKNPKKELLIVLGHGPDEYENNVKELDVLDTHVKRIKEQTDFADVRAYNFQDDAPDLIRSNNVAVLRSWIENATAFDMDVIIVGYLLSTRGIQWKIPEDFKGLEYTFNEKGLSSHPDFPKWIEASVHQYTGGM